MFTNFSSRAALLGALAAAAPVSSIPVAHACGGFFCSQSQPVNQAAERIIFSHDEEAGTVTAIIQIMYEGPSENFSWLLPISSVPEGDEIGVASDLAFQRLQQATNPNYNLNRRVEGTCRQEEFLPAVESADSDFSGGSGGAGGGPNRAGESGVSVAASGLVGAFEWTALELDPELEDPAAAATEWLSTNGYDVAPGSADLIRPYLIDGLYLLALRLTKGADTGSIRPIVLTYDADLPSIPMKLTAVAANDDMGVMTWNLGQSRSVPFNYNALELNEARINWFNANLNYNDVVIEAADEAGGQGFVTEFAGPSSSLEDTVWFPWEEENWERLKTDTYGSFGQLFDALWSNYQSWDGFWDAVRESVTLDEAVRFDDFQRCPSCYEGQVQFSPADLFESVEKHVIEPVRSVQELIDRAPYVTRLYSTLSAEEMNLDPVFAFNAELPELSNQHNADRVIECNSNVYEWEAPWRIELPQGGIVRGMPDDVGNWPEIVQTQPANFKISMLGQSGEGMVVTDNEATIAQALDDYNEQAVPLEMRSPTPGGDPQDSDPGGAPRASSVVGGSNGGGGCSLPISGSTGGASATLLALLGLGWVRRRRA